MQKLDRIKDEDLLSSELLDIALGRVYLLSTGRNAWHSVWSERYKGTTALYFTLADAKKAAQPQRNMGTTFQIELIPSLVLISELASVHCIEFHSKNSFVNTRIETFPSLLKIGSSISDVLEAFSQPTAKFWQYPFPSLDSFVTGKASNLESQIHEPFDDANGYETWKSDASWGSQYLLNWNLQEDGGRTSDRIETIVEVFVENNDVLILECAKDLIRDARKVATANADYDNSRIMYDFYKSSD